MTDRGTRIRGDDLLQVLVEAERDGLYSGHTWIGTIVRRWKKLKGVDAAIDGRAVAPALRRLERAGLVERVPRTPPSWRPTERGRVADAILAEITVDRGGTFRGWYSAGITSSEGFALR